MKEPKVTSRRTLAGLAFVAALCVVSPEAAGQSAGSRAQAALRLLIEYDNGGFTLLSQREVRKVLPPSDELPAVQTPGVGLDNDGAAGQLPAVQRPSGFWYEAIMGDGSVGYRRIVENPILRTFEGVDPEDPTRQLVRVESLPTKRVFSLLVPVHPTGANPLNLVISNLVIYSSPLRPGAQAEPASEIGRLWLPTSQPPVIAAAWED